MGSASKYWIHVRLAAAGTIKKQEIPLLKQFWQQQFDHGYSELSDTLIQTRLVQIIRSQSDASIVTLAEACLRCFISHQILQVCISLQRQFSAQTSLELVELLSCTMDDVNPLTQNEAYQPFAVSIIRSFDPQQGNLNTWTKQLVRQHKELNQVLVEHGIYLASDWAILNHATVARIERWLSGVLLDAEVQRACQLLNSFHRVYRGDRLQQPTRSGKRCSEPTDEQLQRMIADLNQQNVTGYTPTRLLQELRLLAQKLRQIKKTAALSLDDENTRFLAEQQTDAHSEAEAQQGEFLKRYQQVSQQCLEQAVRQAIADRMAQLRRKGHKDETFLQALTLFHQKKQSMTDIATQIGLQKQWQVTRLLGLKQLRLTVKQIWLRLIQANIAQLIADYLDPEQMLRLQNLELLLEELIDQVIAEDATESYNPQRNARSLFATCICRCLES